MNKRQFLPRDLWFFEVKSTWSELVFIRVVRLQTSSEDFGRLRKTSEFFRRLQTSSGIFGNDRVIFKNPTHSREKSLTLISHKKLAGIHLAVSSLVGGLPWGKHNVSTVQTLSNTTSSFICNPRTDKDNSNPFWVSDAPFTVVSENSLGRPTTVFIRL